MQLAAQVVYCAALCAKLHRLGSTNQVPCPFDPAELRQRGAVSRSSCCNATERFRRLQDGRALEHGFRLNFFSSSLCLSRYWLYGVLHLAIYLRDPPAVHWWCRLVRQLFLGLDKQVLSKLYTKGLCLPDNGACWSAIPAFCCLIAACSGGGSDDPMGSYVALGSLAPVVYLGFVLALDARSDYEHRAAVEPTVWAVALALALRAGSALCVLLCARGMGAELLLSLGSSALFAHVECAARGLGRRSRSFSLLPVFDYTSAQNLVLLDGMHVNDQEDFPCGFVHQAQRASRSQLSSWQLRKQLRVEKQS